MKKKKKETESKQNGKGGDKGDGWGRRITCPHCLNLITYTHLKQNNSEHDIDVA